jgi:hypothetical protein
MSSNGGNREKQIFNQLSTIILNMNINLVLLMSSPILVIESAKLVYVPLSSRIYKYKRLSKKEGLFENQIEEQNCIRISHI